MSSQIVAGVFGDKVGADTAVRELEDLGIDRVRSAVRSDDGYILEGAATQRVVRSVGWWAVIGTAVGTVVATLLAFAVWPDAPVWLLVILGAAFGGGAGLAYGGYYGLNERRGELWYEDEWRHVSARDGEVLVVADPGDRREETVAILRRNGAALIDGV